MVSSGDTDVTTVRLEQSRVDTVPAVTFCGTFRHRIDEKGRVAVPAQLRRFLPEGSVVTPGPETRLMIWPHAEWTAQIDRFLRTAETPAQERRFMRLLNASSSPFDVDAQGRLLLSAQQRTFAQIVDQVVFVGVGTGVEVIADELWQSEQADLSPDEFTQVWDLVHQRGTSASPSPA